MIAAFIPAIIGLIGKGIDKAVPDKDEAERLKAQITLEAMKSDGAELQAATSIILAEANGESWLQRNWRPLLMLWFATLVGAHWLGFTPENLSDAVVQDLLGIVQVGIGGYVLGRSAEKVVKEYKR
tara:strand:+ start:5390 stop:5767 length:378 start_codon:yes stop_codon:yes gene_type:complete